ncbi:MAG: hypothetical protein ACKVK9_04445, partial [Nitrospinaceae bacterium]
FSICDEYNIFSIMFLFSTQILHPLEPQMFHHIYAMHNLAKLLFLFYISHPSCIVLMCIPLLQKDKTT